MEYTDYLKTYVEKEVTKFIDGMGGNHPVELREMPRVSLIYNLTDTATAHTRQMIDCYIEAACYQLLVGIRWSQQNPSAGTYKRR